MCGETTCKETWYKPRRHKKYIYNYINKQIVTYIILIDDNVGSDLINGRIYK